MNNKSEDYRQGYRDGVDNAISSALDVAHHEMIKGNNLSRVIDILTIMKTMLTDKQADEQQKYLVQVRFPQWDLGDSGCERPETSRQSG